MNLQLHNVISDVTGATGIAILRDIVAGETDPAVLARHRHPGRQASKEEIAASLTGHDREEHGFVLRQALEAYVTLGSGTTVRFYLGLLAEAETPRTPLRRLHRGVRRARPRRSEGSARRARIVL
jgi:hypothetical protein